MIIFVYGTLLKGQPNHGYLDDSTFLGSAFLPETQLWSTGSFPAMLEGDEITYGELYSVDQKTLKRLDMLEGNGRMYLRKPVWAIRSNTGLGVGAEAYFWLLGQRDLDYIPSGDWRSHDRLRQDQNDPV